MNGTAIGRRDFLAATAAAGVGAVMARTGFSQNAPAGAAGAGGPAPMISGGGAIKIETFDYQNVTLKPSRWQRQFQLCKDFYLGVSDDDILCGYRRSSGQNAPGKPLGGWCATNSNTVFGQWLQGLNRMAKVSGDSAPRDKAVLMVKEWAKTLPADGNTGMGHYPFEKLVGGLVDMKQYGGFDEALALLEKAVDVAAKSLSRENLPANPRPWPLHSGRVLEWYTVPENLFRAYALTKNNKYLELANAFLYTPYWEKFLGGKDAKDVWGVHAYSHVNTWSSCAMAYAVTGDQKYLTMLKNAYDFLHDTQMFATGGYGPSERLMPPNGNLGKALEFHQNSCEAPCCSWAAFKMARYLMTFTGDAKYGDWIERLVYNGVGASLPIRGNGENFYYADYRIGGGTKTYARSTYTCCSGTYIQAVTEYANMIYFKDPSTLYVNLYLPSEVTWKRPEGEVKVLQETSFPEADTITFTVSTSSPSKFALKFRVPEWAQGMSASVNDQGTDFKSAPGTWSGIDREWKNGDKVTLKIPLSFRHQAVDKWTPNRVAVLRGPAVMVMDATAHEPSWAVPETEEELNKVLVASGAGQRDTGLPPPPQSQFAMRLTGKNAGDETASGANTGGGGRRGAAANAAPAVPVAGARFMPFYAVDEVNAYRMYFDKDAKPLYLW